MSTTIERASAQVFQFPPRGRYAAAAPEAVARNSNAVAAIGSAWYHDEAVRDEAQQRNH